jgi:hypothetical protein
VKQLVFLWCFCLLGYDLFAQIDNTFISDNDHADSTQAGKWGFSISNFNYLRNTEYFNAIETGQTLFGSQLSPVLWVQTNKNNKIKAGVFLNHFFGTETVYPIRPIFSLMHQRQNHQFIFGTLNGATSHQMAEPIFNINNAINQRIEEGAQYRFNSSWLFAESWINWQQFMPYRGKNHERFTVGLNIKPKKNFKNGLTVAIPVQAMLAHKGGQLSADSTPQYSAISGAFGAQVSRIFNGKTQFTFTQLVLFTKRDVGANAFGDALFSHAEFKRKNLSFMLSYFNGNNFNALNGTAIYQSFSNDNGLQVVLNRQLFFFRLFYEKEIDNNLMLSARAEPFYDFNFKQVEYAYSLYLFYRLNTAFGKINR